MNPVEDIDIALQKPFWRPLASPLYLGLGSGDAGVDTTNDILLEDGSFLLLEDGSKLLLEA